MPVRGRGSIIYFYEVRHIFIGILGVLVLQKAKLYIGIIHFYN